MNIRKLLSASIIIQVISGCSGDTQTGTDETTQAGAVGEGRGHATVADDELIVDTGPSAGLDTAPEEASYQTLHELSVSEQSIAFYAYERESGAPAITVRGYSPTFQTSVLDQLLDKEGMLTALEVFLALAGKDAVPHPLLVASHEQQAQDDFMRNDLDVRQINFQPAPVEKVFASECDWFIFDTSFMPVFDPTLVYGQWGYWQTVISKGPYNTTARRDICATTSNCALTFRKNTQTIGTCADGNTSSRAVTNFGSGWVAGPWASFGPGPVRWVFYYPGGPQIASVQTNAATTATYYQRANQLRWTCLAPGCTIPNLADQRYP